MNHEAEIRKHARKSARQRERRIGQAMKIAADPEKIAQEAEEGVWMVKDTRRQQKAAQRRGE